MKMLTMAMLGAVLVTTGSAKISGGQIPKPSTSWADPMTRMSQPDAMRLAEQKRCLRPNGRSIWWPMQKNWSR